MIINFQGLDEYESKHTGSWTNKISYIVQMYKQTRMYGINYRKDISNYTFEWKNPWCHATSVIHYTY